MAEEHQNSVSFGFKKKKKSGGLIIKTTTEESSKENEGFDSIDYISGVDGSGVKSLNPTKVKAGPLVIPLIQKNKWRIDPEKLDAECSELEREDTASASEKFQKNNERILGRNDIESEAMRELLAEAKRREDGDSSDSTQARSMTIPLLMQNMVPEGYETDEKLDTDIRPPESTLEDYDDVPIESFGLAMLRGMGWKEGDGLGKRPKKVAPVDAVLRPKGMGLGADRSALLQDQNKKKQRLKPGDEKIDSENLTYKKGAYCKIAKGRHIDLYGIIQGVDEDNCHCIVKLAVSGETITTSQYNLKLVTIQEFDKYSRYLNKGKSDRYKENEARKNGVRERENNSHFTPPPEKKRKSEHSHKSSKSKSSSARESWVLPLLRVKVIDKHYKDGRYYSSKVTVDDVLPGSIVCRTDSGKLLEGLRESQLETVIPKGDNSHVMLLEGKHRKQIGLILARDKHKEKVTIQLLSDRDVLVQLHYDSVCEYTGNVDHLLDF